MKTARLLLLCLLLCSQSTMAVAVVSGSDTTATTKKTKDFGITGIPTISFNRSRGVGFGGLGMLFFKMGNKATTPPSRFVLNAQYTTKNNWFVGGFAQLFVWEDMLRLSVGGGYFSTHFQFYESTVDYGDIEIPYGNSGFFAMLSPLFKVYPHLYVGPTVQIFHSDIDFNSDYIADQRSNVNAIGAVVMYDTKDNQYNPSNGITGNVRYTNNPSWMGNDSTFNKLFLFANYYLRLNPSMVLASRVSANIGLGSVPFASQSYVGGKDIRGYTKGEYRGNQTYALQSELRWNFYKRWGAVGFFGLAMTADPVSQVLPGGGVGLRFKILPKYNINAGLDGALGKDDWGVYFRITEAF